MAITREQTLTYLRRAIDPLVTALGAAGDVVVAAYEVYWTARANETLEALEDDATVRLGNCGLIFLNMPSFEKVLKEPVLSCTPLVHAIKRLDWTSSVADEAACSLARSSDFDELLSLLRVKDRPSDEDTFCRSYVLHVLIALAQIVAHSTTHAVNATIGLLRKILRGLDIRIDTTMAPVRKLRVLGLDVDPMLGVHGDNETFAEALQEAGRGMASNRLTTFMAWAHARDGGAQIFEEICRVHSTGKMAELRAKRGLPAAAVQTTVVSPPSALADVPVSIIDGDAGPGVRMEMTIGAGGSNASITMPAAAAAASRKRRADEPPADVPPPAKRTAGLVPLCHVGGATSVGSRITIRLPADVLPGAAAADLVRIDGDHRGSIEIIRQA